MQSALARAITGIHPGIRPALRPYGKPAGSYVAGQLVECRNAIQLCTLCRNKFDAKRNHYVLAKRWGLISGPCDGCKTAGRDNVAFIHEAYVAEMNGMIRKGHVYSP